MMDTTRRTGPIPRLSCALVVSVLALLTLVGCEDSPAVEEEHEHASVVVTQWNDATELFLEYPHLVAGQATGNWAIHLTDMEDFAPIRSGMLTVRFMRDGGEAESFTIEDVARDGIFLLDPVVETPGTYRVELDLASPQVSSTHVLPEVTVFSSVTDVPHPDGEEGGGIAFLKEQQWQIPFAVVAAAEDTVRRTVTAPGEVVAPDGALVEVNAPVDGLAAAAANRGAPSVGQRVQAGELLVVLSPTAQQGGFAETRAQVERLEREVARAERLLDAGAIPARRLEEAQHDLELARAQAEAIGAGGPGEYLLRLTAPMAGVVAHRSFVPGGRVQAGQPLFTIVDPRTTWVRAQVPVAVASSIPNGARANFSVEGSDQIHETSRLVSIGSVLDPGSRTVPVVFEVAGAAGRFTIGQFARVAVPVGGAEAGVVIPNRAIVDDNGTPVAYVQTGGESFERRVLTLGATDGARTRVAAGIRPGEMVTVTGAYQVRLSSMSGGDFAGGHVH